MADFERAFAQAIELEGGYKLTNDPTDRGGQTYAGISRRAWPQWEGWSAVDAGKAPPAQAVRNLYLGEFWLRHRCDQINAQDVAECVFLGAINAGGAAIKLVQIVVGATQDGVIGPQTLAAINAADPGALIDRLTLAKVDRYRQICTKDRTQLKYLLGWLNRAFKEAVRG